MSFRYEKQFSKKQNIVNFLVRQAEGATTDQIAKEVFNESRRQANQTFATIFFSELVVMLDELILSGHLSSEGDRFFFKASQTDVPMDDYFDADVYGNKDISEDIGDF